MLSLYNAFVIYFTCLLLIEFLIIILLYSHSNFFETDSLFSMRVSMKKRYMNDELKYYRYFYQKIKVKPENIIIVGNFVFFFVKGSDFFKVKAHLGSLRRNLGSKVLIIRAENTLITLLFSFFPDLYIHDIVSIMNKYTGNINITIYFISFEERGIAIGRNGEYIKAVNEIFKKYITFEKDIDSIKIKCEFFQL